MSFCLRRALGSELIQQRGGDSQPVELEVEAVADDQRGTGARLHPVLVTEVDRGLGLTHCGNYG
jgi:hypothetical protein